MQLNITKNGKKNCLLSNFFFFKSKQPQYKLTEAAKDPRKFAITFENFEKLC